MRILIIIVLLAIGLIFIRACSDSSDDKPYIVESLPPLGLDVQLDSGIIRGQEHGESEVWEWLAIPFAQPPVGELRWRAPRPIDPWEQVREARTFGEPCPQLSEGLVIGNEDCLHLNVWRPRTQERGLPVYVWIHGGGNYKWSNSVSFMQGDRLAQFSNLVVVSIQHRLGALGWLYYRPLHTGDPREDSGSFGLLDIIHSLEWIQNNIEAFGGDKGNVTITGESSGAINIMSLLLSEQANGLFHKAIMQSPNPYTPSPDEARAWSARLYDNLTALTGISLEEPTEDELFEFMRNRSAAELVESRPADEPYAITDGTVLPKEGVSLFVTGNYVNKVPMIVGTNRDEYKISTSVFGQNLFPNVSDDVRMALGRYGSDLWRVRGVDQFTSDITAAPDQPDVYAYRFNWGSPDEAGNSPLPGNLGFLVGAFHANEIPLVLGNWDEALNPQVTDFIVTKENADGRKALSEAIMRYFAAFAYSSNPNGHNLPVWEPFAVDEDFKAIQLDVNSADNSLKITADQEIFTVESVLADLEGNLKEPARSEVLEILREVGFLD